MKPSVPYGTLVSREGRFWAKVQIGGPDECWPWTKAHNEHGYGLIRVAGKNVKAHRVALIQGGEDPGPSVKVLHSCDNPPCCNPGHLRFGSQRENVEDMHARGRRVYVRKPRPPKPPPKARAGKFSHVTHCVNGHEFTTENTRLKPNRKVRGGFERVCITCRKIINKEQAQRRKEARHARGLWNRKAT